MTTLLPANSPTWTLSTVAYSSPDARALTQALHHEQLATYGAADDPTDTPAEEFDAPHGMFVVVHRGDGAALACGGWRTISTTVAEIKRMFVSPAARGQGLGRQILASLEQDALSRGHAEILLETGVRNVAALALYTSCGYTPVQPYVPGRDPKINRALKKALQQVPDADVPGGVPM